MVHISFIYIHTAKMHFTHIHSHTYINTHTHKSKCTLLVVCTYYVLEEFYAEFVYFSHNGFIRKHTQLREAFVTQLHINSIVDDRGPSYLGVPEWWPMGLYLHGVHAPITHIHTYDTDVNSAYRQKPHWILKSERTATERIIDHRISIGFPKWKWKNWMVVFPKK